MLITKIRWPVPKSWVWVRIGEVTETAIGATPARCRPEYYGGNIPWLKSSELRDHIVYRSQETITKAGLVASRIEIFPKHTILIARCGTVAGRLGMLALPAATNQAVCGVFPSKRLLPRYLFRYLEFQRPQMVNLGRGVSQTHISLSVIRNTSIPLPPIEEQRYIAREIDSQMAKLQARVSGLKQVQKELAGYRSQMLAHIYERKRTLIETEHASAGRNRRRPEAAAELLIGLLVEKHPRQKRRATSDVGDVNKLSVPKIPEGWVWATADQLCAQITPGWHMRLSYQSRGQYLLKAKNVRNGFIDLTAAGLISDEDFERCPTRCRPTKNDILIVRRGLGTGRAAIVQSDLPAAISNDILLVRPVVDTQFFLNWLQSPFGQDWIARVAGIGVRASLSSSGLKRMPVPLPSSDEQRRTVAELSEGLSATSKFDMLVDRILKCGESLRHEILKWGFEGKLLTSGRP